MDFDQVFFDLAGLDIGEILENEPLYKHTTFKVGGPARMFVNVKDVESLQKAVSFCKEGHQGDHRKGREARWKRSHQDRFQLLPLLL